MIVDPKTRPPPMWSGKKVLRHLFQKNEMLFKNILQSMPLKDSPHTELVRSLEDNLQNEIFFIIKNHCVFAESNRPTQGLVVGNPFSQLLNILNTTRFVYDPVRIYVDAH